MQDLFAKVQTVHADFVFPPLAAHADLAGLEDGAGLAVLPRGLQRHIALGVAVEHAEEVVVGAGHDDAARREGGRVTACGPRPAARPQTCPALAPQRSGATQTPGSPRAQVWPERPHPHIRPNPGKTHGGNSFQDNTAHGDRSFWHSSWWPEPSRSHASGEVSCLELRGSLGIQRHNEMRIKVWDLGSRPAVPR